MQYNRIRYDPDKTRSLIEQLSAVCDPVALMSWIGKKSREGDRPGPEPWSYTKVFFADYGQPDLAQQAAALFSTVGVADEVDAGVWLAEHADELP